MFVDSLDSLFGFVRTLTRIEQGTDVGIFKDELFEADDSLRFGRPSEQWPHREALHVYLRGMKWRPDMKDVFFGTSTENADLPLYEEYPEIRRWVNSFAKRNNGRVERVFIAALGPKSRIYRHADRGYYHAPRDRYHLVLQSKGGEMRIAGQEETLRQGEVWWINNKAAHESFNNSDTARVHLIVDLLPNSTLRRIKNYLRWIYLGLRPGRFTNYYINWPQRKRATS